MKKYAFLFIVVLSFLPFTAYAAANMQIMARHDAGTGDPYDDYLKQTDLKWHWTPDFYLYQAGDRVSYWLDDFSWNEARAEIQRAMNQWSDVSGSDFNFGGLHPHDFAREPSIHGYAALDGHNLITFADNDFPGGADAYAVTSLFYFEEGFDTREIDWDDPPRGILGKVEDRVFVTPDEDEFWDFEDLVDGDIRNVAGIPYRDYYEPGTIIDADIVFNPDPEVDFQIIPDDPRDPGSYRGVPDVRMLALRELGRAIGLADSLLERAVLTYEPFVADDYDNDEIPTDPYEFRELKLDDEMAITLTYPKDDLKSGNYIAGNILDGQAYIQDDDLPDDGVIMANPVYLGYPTDRPGRPDVVDSDRGPIRLVAQVFSGIGNRFPLYENGELDFANNGKYIFPNVPERDDWVLYIEPMADTDAADINEYVDEYSGDEDFSAQFFGVDEYYLDYLQGFDIAEDAGDFVSNHFLEMYVNQFGQYSIGVPGGAMALGNHPFPSRNYVSMRVGGSQSNNRQRALGSVPPGEALELDDSANTADGTWRTNQVEVNQKNHLVGNTLYVEYNLKNTASVSQNVDFRVFWDMAIGADPSAEVYNGDTMQRYTSARTLQKGEYPRTIHFRDSSPSTLVQTQLDLDHTDDPSRILLGGLHDMLDRPHIPNAVGSLDENIAMILCYDGINLAGNEEKRIRIRYDMMDFAGWRDVPYNSITFEDEEGVEQTYEISTDESLLFLDNTVGALENINIFTDTDTTVEYREFRDTPTPPVEFRDVSEYTRDPHLPELNTTSLSGRFADLTGNGYLDMVLAGGVNNAFNFSGTSNRLMINDGTGRFEDVSGEEGRFPHWQQEATYDVLLEDFNNNGHIDIFVSNFAAPGFSTGAQNRLFMNRGDGSFDDVTNEPADPDDPDSPTVLPGVLDEGPFVVGDPSTRPAAADLTRSGYKDIVVANFGFVGGSPEPISNRLLLNQKTESGHFYFADKTYGRNRQPGGDLSARSQRDRLPPPIHIWIGEEDSTAYVKSSLTYEVKIAQLVGDEMPDIFEVNGAGTAAGIALPPDGFIATNGTGDVLSNDQIGFENSLLQNVDRDYMNVQWDYEDPEDLSTSDGNTYADGYFADISFGYDYVTNQDGDRVFIGIPEGWAGNWGADEVPEADQIPLNNADSRAAVIADFDMDGDNDILIINSDGWELWVCADGEGLNSTDAEDGTYMISFPKFTLWNGTTGPMTPIPDAGIDDYGAHDRVYPQFIDYSEVLPEVPEGAFFTGADLIDLEMNGVYDVVVSNWGSSPDNAYQYVLQNHIDYYAVSPTEWEFELVEGVFGGDPFRAMNVVTADVNNSGVRDVFFASGFTHHVDNRPSPDRLFLNQYYDTPPSLEDEDSPPVFVNRTHDYLPLYNDQYVDSGVGTPGPGERDFLNASARLALGDLNASGWADLVIAQGGMHTTVGDYSTYFINTGGDRRRLEGETAFKTPFSMYPPPTASHHPAPYQSHWGFDGDVGSSRPFLEPEPLPSYSVRLADINNSGSYDIIQSNIGHLNNLYINHSVNDPRYNTHPDDDYRGDGVFFDESYYDYYVSYQPYRFPRIPEEARYSRDFEVADLNNNGYPDIIWANGMRGSGVQNRIFLNGREDPETGKMYYGYFEDRTDLLGDTVKDDTYSVAAFDANNSGRRDLFFGGVPTEEHPYAIRVMEHLEDGTFRDVTLDVFPDAGNIDAPVMQILVGDFTGEGDYTEDLNGTGILDPGQDRNDNGVIDWKDTSGRGDGESPFASYDIYLVTQGRNRLFVNDGYGNFTDVTGSQTPGDWRNSFDGAVGDLSNNGHLDIVVTNYGDEDKPIQVLHNDGEGNFTDRTAVAFGKEFPFVGTEQFARGVDLADLDGDGDLDMVVSTDVSTTQHTMFYRGGFNLVYINNTEGRNRPKENRVTRPPRIQNPPTIREITPSEVNYVTNKTRQHDYHIRLKGKNFSSSLEVYMGPDIIIRDVKYVSSEEIHVHFKFDPDKAPKPGYRSIDLIDRPTRRQYPSRYELFRINYYEGETSISGSVWEEMQ